MNYDVSIEKITYTMTGLEKNKIKYARVNNTLLRDRSNLTDE